VKVDRQTLILAEQVRGLYGSTAAIAFGGLVLPPFITVLFWDVMDHSWSMAWVVMVALTAGVWAIALNRQFMRHNHLPHDCHRWLRHAVVRSAASGISWGLFIVTDATRSSTSLIVGGACLIGFGAITVSTLSYYPLAHRIFSVALFSPFMAWSSLSGTATGLVMAALAGGGLLYSVLASRNLGKVIVKSLDMGFENLELVEQLKAQKILMEAARDEAVEANQAKSRFLAAASHDLRQPMHALGLFAAAVRAHVNAAQGAGIVDKMEQAIGSAEVMFNAMLDVSRLDAGVLVPDLKTFAVGELLRRLADEYAPRAQALGLRLRVRPCPHWVLSDAALLERVLRNLISNALRYTRHGGVLVGCRQREDHLAIEVWDTGMGIPPDKLDVIFEEFYQLGNPQRSKANGLGLGLSIVRRISKLLSHPVTVTSRVGQGSRFVIKVPSGVPQARHAALPDLGKADDAALIGAVVLVIDDEWSALESIQLVLKQWGCHVLCAQTGPQALDLLKSLEQAPDIVLSDYRLRHGETGIAAVNAIQGEFGPIPAALITGDTAPHRLHEATASGYALLHKPVNPGQLKALLIGLMAHGVDEP
jgi:signal transduction histidine kinase